MIEVQDGEGILFWPESHIASVRPDFRNRFQVVHRDGSVAHRPTPCSLGPLYCNRQFARPTENGWLDPAQFLFSEVHNPPDPEPEQPPIPQLPCARHQIFALQAQGDRRAVWRTDRGDFVWKTRPTHAARLMPELVRLRSGRYFNPRRLHRILHDYDSFYVVLDNGEKFPVSPEHESAIATQLALPNLMHLEPRWIQLYGDYLLRDWPFELAVTQGRVLRPLFPTVRKLIGHLVWQRLRYREQGLEREWATSYRGFWYDVVAPALYRGGFLNDPEQEIPEEPPEEIRATMSEAEKLYVVLFQVMDHFVQKAQFFTLRQFGFADPGHNYRRIGKRFPHILLVAEKEGLHDFALRAGQEFGISVVLLNHQPSLLCTEYTAAKLAEATPLDIEQINFVDYDAGGWILGHAHAKQLRFFGKNVARETFLIRADSFTEEEKRLHAHPCATGSPGALTKAQNWVKESGGLDGRPYGIHADHIQPYERLRQLLRAVLAQWGIPEP